MRKTLAIILSALMMLTLVPVAFADADLDAALNVEGGTLTFVNDATNPWTVAELGDITAAVSGNAGVDSSTSTMTATVEMTLGQLFVFDYKVSSETNYDGLIVTEGTENVVVGTSGEVDWDQAMFTAPADGEYTFSFTYKKDSSMASGDDCAWIDNVNVMDPPELESFTAAALTVGVGKTGTVVLTPVPAMAVIPTAEVVWASADEAIATVAGGVVTGVAVGETTVTATLGEMVATANITVAEGLFAEGYVVFDDASSFLGWKQFDILGNTATELEGNLPISPYGAEFWNNTMYAFATDGNNVSFYTQDYNTREYTQVAASTMVYDMTFDYSTHTMYGLINDANDNRVLATIDINTGAVTAAATLDRVILTFVCTTAGNLYGVDIESGAFYAIDKASGATTLVGATGFNPNYVQSMAYDHNNGGIYWAFLDADSNGIVAVDETTGTGTMMYPGTGEVCGLFFYYEDGGFTPVSVTGVTLTPETAELNWHETIQLTATIAPADATNKGINWTSSDESVATVVAGLVTGQGEGTATITATTRDGGFTATCEVTVGEAPSFRLYEDFESALDDWTFVDADGDGHEWMLHNFNADSVEAYEGDYCIGSNSYDNETNSPLTPDNWMISPAFMATSDCDLTWYAAAQDPDWTGENYSVYVGSADATSPADFTEVVFNGVPTGSWVQKVVALDEYAGQEIRIAFRHHNISDMFMLKIDLIVVYDFSGGVLPQPTPPVEPTPTPEPTTMFTVTFVDWDDTVIAEVEVAEGEDAVAPADPEREGYLFAGWDGEFTAVTENLTIKATYVAMGDANGDALVNTGDAVTVLKYAVDMITFDDFQKRVADFNGDGSVNTGDAVSILIYCVEA